MTVDLDATITRTFTMRALLAEAKLVMQRLVGVEVPPFEAIVQRTFHRGELVHEGIPAGPDLLLGGEWEDTSISGRRCLSIDFPAPGYVLAARVLVMEPHEDSDGLASVGVSPMRTPFGVVSATSLALAAAALGAGAFVDMNIRFLDPPVEDPVRVIEATAMPRSQLSVRSACLAWVRQFPHLSGWPPDEDDPM